MKERCCQLFWLKFEKAILPPHLLAADVSRVRNVADYLRIRLHNNLHGKERVISFAFTSTRHLATRN